MTMIDDILQHNMLSGKVAVTSEKSHMHSNRTNLRTFIHRSGKLAIKVRQEQTRQFCLQKSSLTLVIKT